ncbi:MAG TPA: sigma-70 family RNA polymerase sigma factor [Micromonosporaceae bacterium]|nr:sigma-70 family RNA polymerase sigma factor [Micromonosporaceae bacterium]
MADSDEQLLAAIAAGPGALPEFYRRHVAKVVGMGVRRFACPEDVADFTADVFVEVMTSASTFDPRRGRAVPWLYGVASHVAARMHRQRARDREAMLRLAGRDLLADDDHARVERRIDAARELRRVYQALHHLDAADRRLLELVAVDGLAPVDAADILGISRVALRVRLSRARRRLREAMHEVPPDTDAVPNRDGHPHLTVTQTVKEPA